LSEQALRFMQSVKDKADRGELLYVGESPARVDGLEKVMGSPVYTADLLPRDTAYAKLFLSPVPHGVIKEIDASAALTSRRVIAVLTWRDIPGLNESAAVLPDRQLYASTVVRSTADIVGAVVAETQQAAADGARSVKVVCDPLPAVFDPLEALKPGSVRVHPGGNVARQMRIRKGDIERGFSEADVIIENTYRTQFQDAAPMETEMGFALPSRDGAVTVIGSMQSPHHTRAAVAKVLGLPLEKVRVVQAFTGGAFGPKSDETPYDVCATAALASTKLGRPVFCSLDREESMVVHTKRHPFIIRHRTGALFDGRLTAGEVEMVSDAGAYASLGVYVLGRATFHAMGAYEFPNVKVDSYLVYTNNTYAGSLRGFGGPQAAFAIECQMEELARKLNMDPLELRLKNMLRDGKRTATGAPVESCGLPQCVDRVVRSSRYLERREEYRGQAGSVRRGLGMAFLIHGNSLGPEGNDYGAVILEIKRDGTVVAGTGLTEYGTGAVSGLLQVAASVLGVPLERFRLDRPDTSRHRETGPTVASRTVVIGGNAAKVAAEKLRKRLGLVAADIMKVREERVAVVDGMALDTAGEAPPVPWSTLVQEAYSRGVKMWEEGYFMAPPAPWDTETGLGTPYLQYTWGALILGVEVDMETGCYRVTDVHVAYDVGRAVNPSGIMGQIYGGTVQGLGYATMEELIHRDGYIVNPSLTDYYIPTSLDIPEEFKAYIVEEPGPLGPFGAKVIAEPPIVLPAPAVRNAILDATGVSVNELPIAPEKVLKGLRGR